MTESPTHPGAADLRDIQGNLIGFNKDLQRLLFLNFPSASAGQQCVAALATQEVNSAAEVKTFNAEFRARVERGEDELTVQASWVNLGLTFAALQLLGADGVEAFPDDFKQGMRARAGQVGDIDTSDPSFWAGAFATGVAPLHALVIVAADSAALLDERTTAIRTLLSAAGAIETAPSQEGETRPGEQRGHEHFGFKDGISQPGILGLTTSSKAGGDIAAGEFLIGWPDQAGAVSGDAVPEMPTQQGDPGYPNPTPSPQPAGLPPWAKNGSFLVYRRLQQNVQGFHSFTQAAASTAGLSSDQLEAKLVGRWPSGAALERVPDEPMGFDPSMTDAKTLDAKFVDDDHINNFGYRAHDDAGAAVPLAAHIRKVYPRDQDQPGRTEADRHRILRRGIPYGPEVQANEEPYGAEPVTDGRDRGLLFLCYQASITRGFEFIQQSWANSPAFPTDGSGQDPIISQNTDAPAFPLPANPHLTTLRWVTTTGGEYFFTPALSALHQLASAAGASIRQ